MRRLAIIGGTGVYDALMLENAEVFSVTTRYGSALLKKGTYKEAEVYFLARHGAEHSIPPHKVNYRANIAALVKLDVTRIIATAAVGSLNAELPPGTMVLLEQFLDFTRSRESTFFTGGEAGVVHTDFTEPYCPGLNRALLSAAEKEGLTLKSGAVYVCTEGPRFETPAEIKMYKQLGADVVGMTNVPEVVLAREAGLCYSTVAMCTNFAAGISSEILTHEEVLEVMEENTGKINRLLAAVIDVVGTDNKCRCRELGGKILL